MRRRLMAGALVAGSAFLALPAAPAQADCNTALYVVTGRCANGCTLARDAYHAADDRTGDALPDVAFPCLA
jgi:hypothetical protein